MLAEDGDNYMTILLTYNWFWLLLFGSVGLAALIVLLVIVYQLMCIVYHLARIADALERITEYHWKGETKEAT